MGRKKNDASPRELKAAEFLFQGPFLNTSQAMKAANYSTGLRQFVSRPVDIVPARTRDLAKQLGPKFEEIDNDTPGSQNE